MLLGERNKRTLGFVDLFCKHFAYKVHFFCFERKIAKFYHNFVFRIFAAKKRDSYFWGQICFFFKNAK